MKSLAVTGLTVGVLNGFSVMKLASEKTPFVNNFGKAGRVGLDVLAVVGGSALAYKQDMHWTLKAVGAGIAIEGFVDGLATLVPAIGGN